MIIELRRTKSKFFLLLLLLFSLSSLFCFVSRFSHFCVSARVAFFLLCLSVLLVSFFVYDKFNDLFLVLCVCVFSALSLVNNNTRLCHVFVVYLVVVSTVGFFFLFGVLYSVSKYCGAWGMRGT